MIGALWKSQADVCFGKGEKTKAIDLYNKVLLLDSSFVSAWSNRGAVHLTMGNDEGCIADCTITLSLLQVETPFSELTIIYNFLM